MAKTTNKRTTAVSSGKKRSSTKPATPPVSDEQKYQMISEAAYFNSQKRAQFDGDPIQDWLQAEQQIEQQLLH